MNWTDVKDNSDLLQMLLDYRAHVLDTPKFSIESLKGTPHLDSAVNWLSQYTKHPTPAASESEDEMWKRVRDICQRYIVDVSTNQFEQNLIIGGMVVSELQQHFTISRKGDSEAVVQQASISDYIILPLEELYRIKHWANRGSSNVIYKTVQCLINKAIPAQQVFDAARESIDDVSDPYKYATYQHYITSLTKTSTDE